MVWQTTRISLEYGREQLSGMLGGCKTAKALWTSAGRTSRGRILAIRVRDKLLLVLSKNAIASDWVEDEVNKAFAEERRRNQLVLFPVRIDETVMKTDEPWAVKLRDQRNIGEFRRWKDHDAYQQAFDRILRDLKATPG